MKIGCWGNRKDNAIDTEKQSNVYFMNLILAWLRLDVCVVCVMENIYL